MVSRGYGLLPEPGGFEGFGLGPEVLKPDHLAVPEGPDLEVAQLGGNTAFAPNPALANGRYDAGPRVGDVLRFDGDVAPRLQEASRVLHKPRNAEIGPGLGEFRTLDEQDKWINYIEAGSEVALAESLVFVYGERACA